MQNFNSNLNECFKPHIYLKKIDYFNVIKIILI